MDYRDFIIKGLNEAAKVANDYFGKVAGIAKPEDSNQVLTEIDLKIGKLLVKKVRQNYPKYNVIDEEAGVVDNGSNYTWVIDPIDGTSNFASGLPFYGVMIGLLQGSTPVVGGIALPYFHEIYLAKKGKGAFCNGKRIAVSKETNLEKVLVAYGIDSHKENPDLTRNETKLLAEILLNVRNIRTSNSVFDAMMVARGKYGAWLCRTSKIWDNVAQQIVIEEAGGLYTDFFGKPMDYSNPLAKAKDNFTICAAPKALHQKLQAIIHLYSSLRV